MAYGYRRSSYRQRASTGYGRGRSSGYRKPARRAVRRAQPRKRVASGRQQVVRLVIEQAPASGISRANERVLTKMNPPPGKAKL